MIHSGCAAGRNVQCREEKQRGTVNNRKPTAPFPRSGEHRNTNEALSNQGCCRNRFMPYFLAMDSRTSGGRDIMYRFHPGHQLACHRHRRPSNEVGLASYLARKRQVSQFGTDISHDLCGKLALNNQTILFSNWHTATSNVWGRKY
ncbi:hypothetical protein V7x_42080 [Crateriforma conspicua]|uniref:Uncharacterized protein n=1 Tax=Crateriforma conspicua TaxID=2527996 RepID=A0A5C6FPV5_9PLAN|nr:hypothetical protein V7x_42080 [Crateriforma conspicua]